MRNALVLLVYFVVTWTSAYGMCSEHCLAHVAEVEVTGEIKILLSINEDHRIAVAHNVTDVISGGHGIAASGGIGSIRFFGRSSWDARWDNSQRSAPVIKEPSVAQLLKPPISLLHCCRPKEDFRTAFFVYSRTLPIISIEDVPTNFLPRLEGHHQESNSPNIWTLVGGEVFSPVSDRDIGQPCQDCGQSSINNDEYQREDIYNEGLLCLGSVLFAFGIVLVYKVWWKVCFDLSLDSNIAVYVAFVLISAALIWLGGGIVLWRIGVLF